MREALFSRLDGWDALAGARVLDLYAGTGALALGDDLAARGALDEPELAAVVDVDGAVAGGAAGDRGGMGGDPEACRHAGRHGGEGRAEQIAARNQIEKAEAETEGLSRWNL